MTPERAHLLREVWLYGPWVIILTLWVMGIEILARTPSTRKGKLSDKTVGRRRENLWKPWE